MDLTQTLQAVQAAAKAAFAKVEGSAGWDLRLSPPFPATWPPTGATLVHAYAARFDPSLSDAERTAPPWGRVRIAPDGAISVEGVATRLGEATPQGFFPVTKEHPLRAAREAAQRSVLSATSEAALDAAAVRAFYCAWLGANGVAGRSIQAQHAGFVAWLKCR